jgi:hypothetical protein
MKQATDDDDVFVVGRLVEGRPRRHLHTAARSDGIQVLAHDLPGASFWSAFMPTSLASRKVSMKPENAVSVKFGRRTIPNRTGAACIIDCFSARQRGQDFSCNA